MRSVIPHKILQDQIRHCILSYPIRSSPSPTSRFRHLSSIVDMYNRPPGSCITQMTISKSNYSNRINLQTRVSFIAVSLPSGTYCYILVHFIPFLIRIINSNQSRLPVPVNTTNTNTLKLLRLQLPRLLIMCFDRRRFSLKYSSTNVSSA